MEDWISGTFAVLGTLMVLAGATLIVLKTLGRLGGLPDAGGQPLDGALGGTTVGASSSPPSHEPEPAAPGRRLGLRKLSLPTQLIGWGILLLVLAAVAVGLIELGINLNTPGQ